ncbi:nucleotidyltransferase domain-containing protein [uncultured Methanobrevibacter sp.]|uniref:nucleotidyltransferase domain-containing protein n=1 Tax=uncultured Methanobrevibacter sp. TaxID=253161 RepID=UPI0025D9E585|nr:nucleotidyltransferase domain-containing protein [uncultured Methanobrevibacter sp.]
MIILYNRFEIAQEFANAIDSDEIIKMILFGFVARGDDNEELDIDILIVIHNKNHELESIISNIVVDFILEKEEIISPHIMTEEHFNKTKDYSFLKNVMDEGGYYMNIEEINGVMDLAIEELSMAQKLFDAGKYRGSITHS